MSRIIFQESYIVVLPSFSKTATHKHPFMHLFVGANGCKIKVEKRELQSNIIMLDSNVEHVVEDRADCDFFLLIDPTSAIAEKIIDKYLCDSRYYDIDANIADIPKDINALSDKEIAKAVFLSESRLTHLFKENTGISLKSYILIRRLEHDCLSKGYFKNSVRNVDFTGVSAIAYAPFSVVLAVDVSVLEAFSFAIRSFSALRRL